MRQHHIQLLFHHFQSEYLRQFSWPIPGSHCLFRVLRYDYWRDADIWLLHSAEEISDFGPPCVLPDRLPGTGGQAGVIADIKRILLFMQRPKFPQFSHFRRW